MRAWVKRVPAFSGFLVIFNLGVAAQDSESCGVCHRTHYREWLQSPHTRSWKSPDFQLQLEAVGARESCGRCHAPDSVWAPVEMTVSGLEETASTTPEYNPELRPVPKAREQGLEDGVSCGVCHRIVIIWNQGSRSDEFLGPYHTTAGHGGKESPVFAGFQLCRSCHGRPRQDYLPDGGTEADFYHSRAEPFSFSMGTDCAGCHMPVSAGKLIQLSVFKEAPERTVREHTFAVNHYKGLESGLELSSADGKLVLTNKGIGHPLGLSPTSKYRLAISRMDGKNVVEEKKLDLLQARNLTPGASVLIELPFPYEGEGSIRVDLIRVMKGDVEGKVLSKTL